MPLPEWNKESVLNLKEHLTRRNLELACLGFLILCALSVFIGQIPSQQTLKLDQKQITYTGQVRAGKPSGTGKITFSNGDTYQGQFKNGLFEGKGTFTSKTGWTYVGEFKNGLADGQGKLTTESKTVYKGTFKEGIYQHAD